MSFKPGDLVRLKSGSPTMVVAAQKVEAQTEQAHFAVWVQTHVSVVWCNDSGALLHADLPIETIVMDK